MVKVEDLVPDEMERRLLPYRLLDDHLDTRDMIEFIDSYDDDDADDDDQLLLSMYKELLAQLEDESELQHGILLIAEGAFREYAQELAEDIGAWTGDEPWPQSCIDWDRAVRELQVDYTPVEVWGRTYWCRL